MTAEPAAMAQQIDIAELCFAARALAQSHPMTETARRYRQACFVGQRAEQPLPEFADWATTALDVGYCLRRVEEETISPAVAISDLSDDELRTKAGNVADQLRLGDAGDVALLPPEATVAALDRLIATELDKRADNVRDQLDESDWLDLEAYVAWWVIHGYSTRVAESTVVEQAPEVPGP